MKKVKKILFAANIESFFIKFLIPQLKYFKEKGYEVYVAAKNENIDIPYCDKKFDVCFARSLNPKESIKSYKQMCEIFKNNHFDIVSCHTPFGGAITRLAAKKCGLKDTRIVYMAHGFHFYKGAPMFNWILYYNVEKKLAKYTDKLITINLDDYEIAKKKFDTDVYLVKGVGLDQKKYDKDLTSADKKKKRTELNLKEDDFVIIYAAELLPRKRQIWLIKSMEKLLKENPNFKLLLPGKDSMKGKCQKYVDKIGLNNQVLFLGFRKDIPELLKISNLAVSSSKQEGLPVNIMEAMYCGLPIVATSCRGNRDLIKNGENGYVVGINDAREFCEKIKYFSKLSKNERDKIKELDKELIEEYLLNNVINNIVSIYENR